MIGLGSDKNKDDCDNMFRKVLINEEQKCKRSKCRKSLVVAGVKEDENFHWCAGL